MGNPAPQINALLVALSICLPASATEKKWEQEGPKTLQLRLGLVTPGLDFALKGPGPEITFVPNSPTSPFLGLTYKKLGASFQLPTDPEKESEATRGKSRIVDYQLRFFGHRSTHEVIFQEFKGYALQDWSYSGKPILRPDLKVRFIGVNFFRSLSPANYSKAIAFDQKGIQLRQGGALFLWASGGETRIEGSEPLVPAFVRNGSGEIGYIESLKMYSAVVGLGYGHLFPLFSRFYFTASAFLAAGLNYNETDLLGKTDGQWAGIHRLSARAGTGYNYGHHVSGLQMIVDQNTSSVRDGEIQQATFTLRLFYAYRFGDIEMPFLDRVSERVP